MEDFHYFIIIFIQQNYIDGFVKHFSDHVDASVKIWAQLIDFSFLNSFGLKAWFAAYPRSTYHLVYNHLPDLRSSDL